MNRPPKRLPPPPALFPITDPVNGPLDMLPVTEDPTGRGERAWDLMSRLPITEGEHAGKRIGENAPPWMPRLVKLIFGHVDQGGHRMLREVFVNIAKKNGKTSAAAALALTFLLLDEAPREQVLFVAATLDQAHIAFNSMAAMIQTDPWLGERFRVIQHRNTIEVLCDPLNRDRRGRRAGLPGRTESFSDHIRRAAFAGGNPEGHEVGESGPKRLRRSARAADLVHLHCAIGAERGHIRINQGKGAPGYRWRGSRSAFLWVALRMSEGAGPAGARELALDQPQPGLHDRS